MADQPDLASQWQSFDPARRDRLLARMSPEQKKSLRTAIEAQQKTAASTKTAQPGVLKRTAKSFLEGMGLPSSSTEAAAATPTPREAAVTAVGGPALYAGRAIASYGKNLYEKGKEAVGEFEEAGENIGRGQPVGQNIGKAAYAGTKLALGGVLAPFGGEALEQYGEHYGAGEYPEAAGSAVAALTSAALTAEGKPKVEGSPGFFRRTARQAVGIGDRAVQDVARKQVDKAVVEREATRAHNKTADERARGRWGAVDTSNRERLQTDVEARKKVEAKNSAALEQHAKDVEQAKKENAKAIANHQKLTEREQEHHDKSAEFHRRIDQAKVNAKKENDANWAEWRKKIAGQKAKMGDIVGVIQGQTGMNPQEVSEFRQILHETNPDEGDMNELQLTREEVARGQGISGGYEGASPQQKSGVDNVVKHMGLDETETAGLKDVPAERLHGWKTQLERGVRKATSGNVKHAIGQVLNAVRAEETNVSKAAGAEGDLAKARATHEPYVETFRNSPNEPPTVASDVKKKVTPDFTSEQALQEQLAQFTRYDPQIGSLAGHIASLDNEITALRKTVSETKGEKPLPEQPTPEPLPRIRDLRPYPARNVQENVNLPIERPEVSSRKIREDLVRNAAARWRQTSQYQVRRLAASGIGGVIASVTGHSALEGVSAGYLAAEFVPKMAAALVERPRVLKWLAEPSLGDINALKTIPNVDAVKIADTIAQVAIEEARAGHPVTIGKDAVHFLGPARVAAIQLANRPQSAGDAKKRIQAVQGK